MVGASPLGSSAPVLDPYAAVFDTRRIADLPARRSCPGGRNEPVPVTALQRI
jgi:hypothetical protein